MPDNKEPHYFCCDASDVRFEGPVDYTTRDSFVCDVVEYRKLFRQAQDHQIVGEATTTYLYSREAARRIDLYLNDPKIVIVVRHPMERAYSAFKYLRLLGSEPCEQFYEALLLEDARRERGWSPIYWYQSASAYSNWIPHYLDHFGSNVHVILTDDLACHQESALKGLCQFLDISYDNQPIPRLNRSGHPRYAALYTWLSRPNSMKDRVRSLIPKSLRLVFRQLIEWATLDLRSNRETVASDAAHDLFRETISRERDYVEGLLSRSVPSWR